MRRLAIDFEALFQSMPTPFMVLDTDLRFVAANAAYLEMTARSAAELVGVYVFDAFPETAERQDAARQPFTLALSGQESVARTIFAIDRPGQGRKDVHWDVHHTPVRNHEGVVTGVLQFAVDVSAEIEAERMRDVISQEYDHRVRNMMAKVSAIARQTARHTVDTAQFLADFDRRISAMARTHELLVNGGWETLSLRALIESELQPFANHGIDQTLIEGQDCSLSSRVAQALGMALHELATNAAKHGALSRPDGRLTVSWQSDVNHAIILSWIETGLSALQKDASPGFGTTIIDRILPLETDGIVHRVMTPNGLTCTITLPNRHKP
ncbi:MAG: hypothetical protein RL490_1236 [Pseudomonadota bacterium]